MFALLSGRRHSSRQRRFFVCLLEDRTVPIAGYFRIAEYNIASSGGSPATGLDTLMQGFSNEHLPMSGLPSTGFQEQLDIIALQEVQHQNTTTQAVVNLLNGLYGAGIYARGSLDGASTGSGTQGVVYNQQKLQLVSEVAVGTATTTGQPRQAMRYLFHPLGFAATNDFYIYNSHYKADTDSTSQNRRLDEAQAIRADADALGSVNILYVGDFNVYTSTEAAYQYLLSAGNGQAFDPINRPGSWHNSASFNDIFTQAPAVSPPGGLTGGGLDDRFDFQLNSGELTDGANLDYVAGTYHTFGNNGSVPLNGNINAASSTALPDLANRTTVLDLLTTVTDHLPVVADYRIVNPPRITGVQVNEGSVQRSMVTSLTVSFDQSVLLPGNPATAFTLTKQGGGSVTLAGTVSGNSVTLTFTGGSVDNKSLADGRYTLTALASQINNGFFDGNGDGIASDNYSLVGTPATAPKLFRLFGDADGNGLVDGVDFGAFRTAFNTNSSIFDFDGSGIVDGTDFGQFRTRFGVSI